ncbi:pyocin knob domain-containing protein [Serratia marcescens]|uniref:pyocin knob domain-containing protein n=1 Tax=Serratia marcescens TaxID=615 RepID=UPI00124A49C8|nr:pyocin knob domain-containing protein [Serratia marcescens]KAB1583315.1 hypothetical protein F7687_02970 [Serratia marcescens]
MDRKIVYPGAIPLETDLLETNRFALIGLAKLAGAMMGTNTYLRGLSCHPTQPASLGVTLDAGEIYSLQNVDESAYSSLPADTKHSILKQGILADAVTLALPAPATAGFSINYLVQVGYQEIDAENTVLPYYNASNPTQAWHGPNNSGVAQGTVRAGQCMVKAKAGVAATTGMQTTPAPDAGYVGAYVVTVKAGQTGINAADIALATNAPFLPAAGLVAGMQSGVMNYAPDEGKANAYAARYTPPVTALVDGIKLTFKAKNANTAASTFTPNGLAAAPIYSNVHAALKGGEILATSLVEVEWNSTLGAWVLVNTNLASISQGLVKTVNTHKPDANGDVELKAPDVGALPLYPTPLTVDLNTLGATSQAGVYCQTKNAGATDEYHYPIKLAGSLLLTPSAYGCQQEYTEYTAGRKFVRDLIGAWNGKDGPWGDWREYYSENHLPPSYGWGMGPQHKDDAYSNIAQVFRVNGTSVNAPGPNVYGVISVPCDGGPSTSYFAASNNGRAYIGYSNKPENGVIWTEVYTVKNPPTPEGINAVKKSGDEMTGPLTTPYVASTQNVTPEGAGAYADQLNSKAPFFQPNWQWPVNAGGIFVPIAKGASTRKDKGYPGAVSYGYLMPGNNEHPHPTIHIHGDSDVDCAWDFNPYNGNIKSKAGTFATQEWVNTAVHTNELKVGDAQMATDGNIWGTRWNANGEWLWDAIVAQIQNVGQMSVNGTQWWAKINMNGGTLIVQGGYAEVRDAETTDRIGLNIAVPNRLLGVFITNKNFAQGYATYNPQVTVLDDNTGFNFVHGQKERMMYWIAVGY